MTQTHEINSASADRSRIGGRYRIERTLAEGGMGIVYCVTDEETGQLLALKRMLPGSPKDLQSSFEREYRTLAGLQHPRIIRAFEYGVDAGVPYYTMELLAGRDLYEFAPIPFEQACRYLRVGMRTRRAISKICPRSGRHVRCGLRATRLTSQSVQNS